MSVIRTDINWATVEQSLGTYNWSPYDSFVSRCAAHNIKVFGILDYGNDLYDSNGYTTNDPGYYGTAAFRNGFTNFASAAVRSYSSLYPGKVVTWELWNEPNDNLTVGGFWPGGSATQYMALANQVVPAMRDKLNLYNSSATIIAPALANAIGTQNADVVDTVQYLGDCKNSGLLNLVDGVSVHSYRGSKPETICAQL